MIRYAFLYAILIFIKPSFLHLINNHQRQNVVSRLSVNIFCSFSIFYFLNLIGINKSDVLYLRFKKLNKITDVIVKFGKSNTLHIYSA